MYLDLARSGFIWVALAGFDSISFDSKPLEKEEAWHPKVAQCLTLCIKAGLAKCHSIQFPVGKEEQQAWVLDCLLHSTRVIAKPGVAAKVCDEVQKLMGTVAAGNEAEHLSHVLQFCDFRGSEVSLREGTVKEGNRQVIPYPAVVWAWRNVQAHPWLKAHHINVLELVVFLITYVHV